MKIKKILQNGQTQTNKEFNDYAKILRAKIKNKNSDNILDLYRMNPFVDDRNKVTTLEHNLNVQGLLNGLDADGFAHFSRLIEKLEKSYGKTVTPLEQLYSEEELECLKNVKAAFSNSIRKVDDFYQWNNYKLPINHFEESVFYYKHGLDTLITKDSIGGKAILDVGGFIADSVLIFREMFPNNPIYSFEPIEENYQLACKTLLLNEIKNAKIEKLALGDTKANINMVATESSNFSGSYISENGSNAVNMDTLDSYVASHNISVGLIKVDIEGYEPNFLKGAEKTIREQKPILLISIYHNYHDFYKIKPLIASWNLGYRFDCFQGVQNCGNLIAETLLIAEQV